MAKPGKDKQPKQRGAEKKLRLEEVELLKKVVGGFDESTEVLTSIDSKISDLNVSVNTAKQEPIELSPISVEKLEPVELKALDLAGSIKELSLFK